MCSDNNKILTAKPKTVELEKDNPELLQWFRDWVASFRYMNQAMRESGFNYRTICTVIKDGTCSPDTVDRIKELQKLKTAA